MYKAAVLKKVTTACCAVKKKEDIRVSDTYFILKAAEIKKTEPASAGGERGDGSSDAKDTGSKHKDEASCSAAITEELHGFTSASEIYSVRPLQYTPSPASLQTWIFAASFK